MCTDIWEIKGGIDEALYSTDDSSDDDQPVKRRPFDQGQVYYSSMGKQVQVYPVEVNTEVEVTLV